MLRLLLILFFFLFWVDADAQFPEAPLYFETVNLDTVPGDQQLVILTTTFINNYNQDEVLFQWFKTESIPDGWESSVCDENICWPPTTLNEGVVIPGNNHEYIYKLYFYTYGVPGEGYVDLRLRSEFLDDFEIRFQLDGSIGTSIQTISNTNNIRITPNPVINVLHLVGDELFFNNESNFQIFNINGQLEWSGRMEAFDLNVEHLNPGRYFLQIKNLGETESMLSFVKQ